MKHQHLVSKYHPNANYLWACVNSDGHKDSRSLSPDFRELTAQQGKEYTNHQSTTGKLLSLRHQILTERLFTVSLAPWERLEKQSEF